MTHLSIIVPVLNEAEHVAHALFRLAPLRARGARVIVVDGGSCDDTRALAAPLADLVLGSARGRAVQMNAGAAVADGDALLFLHADTQLPANADAAIAAALRNHHWGRFDAAITGAHPMLPVIAALMNLRSRSTGIATGDQAIFVRRASFERVGGYAAIPLMEDIDISKRLRRVGWPACVRARASTSGRRWEQHGVWRTIFLMWRLRLAFFLGADPRALALDYGYTDQE